MAAAPQVIPPEFTQQFVHIRFAEPVRKFCKEEFLRIRITADGRRAGEQDFYRSEIVQPHRAAGTFCKVCKRGLKRRVTDGKQECRNPFCSEFRIMVEAGPTRGVVKVATRFEVNDHVAFDHNLPDGMIDGCVLCLDRRYDTRVLRDIYRSAREIGEQCGLRVV